MVIGHSRTLVAALALGWIVAAPALQAPATPAEAAPDAVTLGRWHVIGPFQPPGGKSAFAAAFPPEQQVDLAKPCGKLAWEKRPGWLDGFVHPMTAGDSTATYLYRTIAAEQARTVTAYLGSDDGLVVWLNGAKVLSADVARGAAPNQHAVKLSLRPGENRLLLKIHNRTGDCGFYFSTSPQPRSATLPENLAPKARASASGTLKPACAPRYAVDGKIADPLSSEDDYKAWAVPGNAARGKGHFTLEWNKPVTVAEIVYFGRTAWDMRECWRDYEVRVFDGAEELLGLEPKVVAKGTFRMVHGPQPVYLDGVRTQKLQVRFLSSHGGANPGAAEIMVFATPAPPAALAKLAVPSARPRGVARAPAPVQPAGTFDERALQSLRLAIEDLTATFGRRYPKGQEFLARLSKLEQGLKGAEGQPSDSLIEQAEALRTEALLRNNPLIDFDRLLLIRRGRNLGLPQNWQGNCALRRNGYDNEIVVLSPVDPAGKLQTLFRPPAGRFVGDVDLHFDADRLLFSMRNDQGRFQVYEIPSDPGAGAAPRQVTPDEPDVDHYDACYLPSERIVFASTACFQGVPCVGGGNQVANLYLMEPDGTGVRQLCFDQDHNWCPTVLPDGRILFTRWEYSDTPHYFSRILMRMNPDGTGQMAYYGSNSYWPNSLFYARPIPGHASNVVGIVSGHHGVPRMGELVLFDPAVGQQEAEGAVQRIPGWQRKVQAIIRDGLVNGSWPKFLHPYPLSEKYFLVSAQISNRSAWGLYLVDVFDNFVPILEVPGYALLEPVPIRRTPRPRIIPDRVDLKRKDALVYLSDIYLGEGLAGVPRGTVKALRLFMFDYGYQGLANHTYIGIDGPWDVHRILGTVPVEPDGSAVFRVPANTPIAVQPLDADGKALQVMRSWFVGMPGENLSCVGCHERLSHAPPVRLTEASRKPPVSIQPWYGPARGFSFKREVQPVLTRRCTACHNGQQRPDGRRIPDLRSEEARRAQPAAGGRRGGSFAASYVALHPYVRRPSPESDYHLLPPGEYAADTSELVQMLRKGHHGVRLDREAWERIFAWIDLNVPNHGTWGEFRPIPNNQRERRRELRKLYAGIDDDYEVVPAAPEPVEPVMPDQPPRPKLQPVACPSWPFGPAEAKRRQEAAGKTVESAVALGVEASGEPVKLELVLIPGGEFVMGDADGCLDELPPSRVRIAKPFWLGRLEVTNRQYALFDPDHDSRYFNRAGKDQGDRGIPLNGANQPVVRVSWLRAQAFCRWLSAKTGRRFCLPTEAQWEYACRAGTAAPLSYGDLDEDFAKYANCADAALAGLSGRAGPRWRLAEKRFNDRAVVTTSVGTYEPNAWGLHDMHGNAAEWTASTFRCYPYSLDGSGDNPDPAVAKVVRGGSFYDRPKRCRSAFRLAYPAWRRVYNVGFRVTCQD